MLAREGGIRSMFTAWLTDWFDDYNVVQQHVGQVALTHLRVCRFKMPDLPFAKFVLDAAVRTRACARASPPIHLSLNNLFLIHTSTKHMKHVCLWGRARWTNTRPTTSCVRAPPALNLDYAYFLVLARF